MGEEGRGEGKKVIEQEALLACPFRAGTRSSPIRARVLEGSAQRIERRPVRSTTVSMTQEAAAALAPLVKPSMGPMSERSQTSASLARGRM